MASGNINPGPPQLRTRQRLITRTKIVHQNDLNRERSRDRRTRNKDGDLVEDSRRRINFKRNPKHRTLSKLPREAFKSASYKISVSFEYGSLFKLVGAKNYFEETEPINFGAMWFRLRIFPCGDDDTPDNESLLGVNLLNPEAVLNDVVNKQKLTIIARMKRTQSIQTRAYIVMGNFGLENGAMQYVKLNILPTEWKDNTKVCFEFTYKQEPFVDGKQCSYYTHSGLDFYKSVLQLGTVHIYSSCEDDYVIGNEFVLRAVCEKKHKHIENKENEKNKNMKQENEEITVDDDDYLSFEHVGSEKSLLCSFSLIFKNEIGGLFKTSNHFSMNIPLQQIKCLIYFMCNRHIHNQADPCTMAALGHYLHSPDLVDDALKLAITELCPENYLRTAALFQYLKVGKDQGLTTLAEWIQKEKEEGNIDLDSYTLLKNDCPYVENMIDCTKPAEQTAATATA